MKKQGQTLIDLSPTIRGEIKEIATREGRLYLAFVAQLVVKGLAAHRAESARDETRTPGHPDHIPGV